MPTIDKDFKVKNGLLVTGNGSFGGPVSVGTPTLQSHAVTKDYVDSLSFGGGTSVVVSSTEPQSPLNGNLWLDTNISRLKVYLANAWLTIANTDDAFYTFNHIHGTDGTVQAFSDGGDLFSIQNISLDGLFAGTTTWTYVLDGGDVFIPDPMLLDAGTI